MAFLAGRVSGVAAAAYQRGRRLQREQHRNESALKVAQRLDLDGGFHGAHRLACHGESMGTRDHGVSP